MTHHLATTIAAIATAVGQCGIGVIRISGPEAFDIAARIFRSRFGADPTQFESHTVHYGSLIFPGTEELVDNVLLTVFRAPRSYTGEDTAEISCHGGIVTLRRALECCFAAGARPAEPGEFTRRAFLNGRLDLSQAEAVNDLIRARTNEAQRLALRQLGGQLSATVSRITDSILSILSRVEASIDFPDDVEEPDYTGLDAQLDLLIAELDELISTSDRGRIYREGIGLAIVGRPNVGKSSLLNALLRQARAIVTPIPGTTRDVIEETINIRGIPVVAADTAGLRTATDEVERIGIELTERAMAASSIILVVLDASSGITDEDLEIIGKSGGTTVIVLNKIDLVDESIQQSLLHDLAARFPRLPAVAVSASTGHGVEQLEDRIAETVLHGGISLDEGIFVTNARHKQALVSARESLWKVVESLDMDMPVDFLSVDLRAARTSLGEITGDTATDDLIDRIFGDFCVGK